MTINEMKVLVVHNFYQSSAPSGEDSVFRNEVELLRGNGVEVITYEKHNDDAVKRNKLRLGLGTIWSRESYAEINHLIKQEKPDIAHFHNIWYLISPSAYYACKEAGVLVVQTLHNFRMFCANGLLMRNGRVCEECLPAKQGDSDKVVGYRKSQRGNRCWEISYRLKILKNAIKYGCYRNSKTYTLPVAVTAYFHWIVGTWVNTVDAYIALTNFGKAKFIEAGLPSDKIFVKPNFLANFPKPHYSHRNYAVFLGRLSVEKGLNVLIDSIKYLPPKTHNLLQYKIIGDGPLQNHLEEKVIEENLKNIVFTGRKSFNECMAELSNAKFVVMPAVWYETFGLTGIEAFACGKPVIASNLGSMAELVEDGKTGLLFEPGNAENLAAKMKWMLDNPDACIEMGKNARKEFEKKYTAGKNFEILMDIYNTVLDKYRR